MKLLYHVSEAPWGRSVRELLARYFSRLGASPPEELMVHARELDRHYIPSRYPSAHPSGTREAYDEEASKRALSAAREVVRYAGEALGA